ncbi:hypothetical protein LSTR_LSTR013830 [Laodelphax striatellus]|uniref:Apoptosis regulatory protein Siva n=1 Tax=Laodelphax striatellus TaxID=195883 RepID=A0A482XSD9_LAOST|nr:hypothetical protein LSTR_LSTR013830 [Laodelphax striatellus]
MSVTARKRLFSELDFENGRQFKVRIREKELNEKSVLREAKMNKIYEKTRAILFAGANSLNSNNLKKNENSSDIKKSSLPSHGSGCRRCSQITLEKCYYCESRICSLCLVNCEVCDNYYCSSCCLSTFCGSSECSTCLDCLNRKN